MLVQSPKKPPSALAARNAWRTLILGCALASLGLAAGGARAESVAEWIAQGRAAATPAEAREAFDRALEAEPDNLDALMGRGQAAADNPARLSQADADFSRVIDLRPEHWEAYLRRGVLRHRIGRDARFNSQMNTGKRWLLLAMDDLTRYLAAQPRQEGADVALALEMRARSHTILDEYAEALRDFEAAAAADPAQATAFEMERARLITIQGKKELGLALYASVAEALRDAARAAAAPRAVERIAERGEALWQLGRKEEACTDFRWLCAEAAGANPSHLHCARARERCP